MNKTKQGSLIKVIYKKNQGNVFSVRMAANYYTIRFQLSSVSLNFIHRSKVHIHYVSSIGLSNAHTCCYHTTTWHWCARPVTDAANDRSTDVWLRLLANQRLCLLVVMDTATQLVMTFDFSHISSHRSGESWKLYSNCKE